MEEVFGPDGLIARHHPNYEYRPGQIEMAEAVHQTLTDGGISLIEAGTGTGKTLAYLIPALVAGRRVVVTTATKALQEQLYQKDIPFLRVIMPREFKAVCMKVPAPGSAQGLARARIASTDSPISSGPRKTMPV